MQLRYASISLACGLLGLAGAAAAQPMPRNNPAAAANVHESELYDNVLRTNPSFRAKRIAEECGPVTDPQLHADCVASFNTGAEAPVAPPPPRRR
jgi:hypothetical protein